jgi:hypothetical protein
MIAGMEPILSLVIDVAWRGRVCTFNLVQPYYPALALLQLALWPAFDLGRLPPLCPVS